MDRLPDSGNSEPTAPRSDTNGFVNRRSVGSIPTTGSESQNTDFACELAGDAPRSGAPVETPDSGPFGTVSEISGAPWTTGEILIAVGRLEVRGERECWPTRGSCIKDGYGRFFARGRDYQLHRVILEGKLGRRLGPNEQARHTCDNPPCGNPEHLVPGSTEDNNHDALARDRRSLKLSAEAVREIRASASGVRRGDLSELARRHGVSPQYIGRIVRGARRTILPALGLLLLFVAGAAGCDRYVDGGQCQSICLPRVVQSVSADACVCGPICVENGFPRPDCNFASSGGGK